MKWKTGLLLISAFSYFAIMLFLTCFAKDIKNANLTHVQAEKLPLKMFPLKGANVNGAEGSVRQKCYALPEELLKEGAIYRVDSEIVNGEECFFVRKIELLTGEEADGSGLCRHRKMGRTLCLVDVKRSFGRIFDSFCLPAASSMYRDFEELL